MNESRIFIQRNYSETVFKTELNTNLTSRRSINLYSEDHLCKNGPYLNSEIVVNCFHSILSLVLLWFIFYIRTDHIGLLNIIEYGRETNTNYQYFMNSHQARKFFHYTGICSYESVLHGGYFLFLHDRLILYTNLENVYGCFTVF